MHREQQYNTTISGHSTPAQKTDTEYRIHNLHTIRTQFAHTQHSTEQNTRYNNNMQHIEDNRENNTEQENREQYTQDNAQPQRTENSAHNYRTYSLDYYFEYAYINNSNTIEIYTILK